MEDVRESAVRLDEGERVGRAVRRRRVPTPARLHGCSEEESRRVPATSAPGESGLRLGLTLPITVGDATQGVESNPREMQGVSRRGVGRARAARHRRRRCRGLVRRRRASPCLSSGAGRRSRLPYEQLLAGPTRGRARPGRAVGRSPRDRPLRSLDGRAPRRHGRPRSAVRRRRRRGCAPGSGRAARSHRPERSRRSSRCGCSSRAGSRSASSRATTSVVRSRLPWIGVTAPPTTRDLQQRLVDLGFIADDGRHRERRQPDVDRRPRLPEVGEPAARRIARSGDGCRHFYGPRVRRRH